MALRGGFREGSGRKKEGNKQLSLRVPEELITKLNEKFSDIKERNKEIVNILQILAK